MLAHIVRQGTLSGEVCVPGPKCRVFLVERLPHFRRQTRQAREKQLTLRPAKITRTTYM